MTAFFTVWAISSCCILLAIYGLRCLRQRRLARPWKMHLPGLLALCAVLGWVPAYLYDAGASRTVDLPPQLQDDRPPLSQSDRR